MPAGAKGDAPWRLIVDPPADGAWNMAVDEALLETYAGGSPPPSPTLRLYGWRPPCLSLGRFQHAGSAHDPDFLRRERLDLVRRPTGGRAVLHEDERTYAVIARLRTEPFAGGVAESYRRVAAALRRALESLGIAARAREPRRRRATAPLPEACFAELGAHEIAVEDNKLVGSAQLRRRGAFLQHGSILIRCDEGRLARAIGAPRETVRLTDLERATGGPVEPRRIDRALVAAFGMCFRARLEPDTLTEEESARATRLRAWKYLSVRWTLDGRIGEREPGRSGPLGR